MGELNLPWGLVLASPHFGKFSNDVLVGNLGDGNINAFSKGSGKYQGALKDDDGQYISIDGLWALAFGMTLKMNGGENQFFSTAGPLSTNKDCSGKSWSTRTQGRSDSGVV